MWHWSLEYWSWTFITIFCHFDQLNAALQSRRDFMHWVLFDAKTTQIDVMMVNGSNRDGFFQLAYLLYTQRESNRTWRRHWCGMEDAYTERNVFVTIFFFKRQLRKDKRQAALPVFAASRQARRFALRILKHVQKYWFKFSENHCRHFEIAL